MILTVVFDDDSGNAGNDDISIMVIASRIIDNGGGWRES